MKKENSTDSPDGVSYEGFCIDLLNALQGKLQFEYKLKLRHEFGEKQADSSWSGMIGELAKKVNCNWPYGTMHIYVVSTGH